LALICLWLGSSYAVAYKLTRRLRPAFDEPPPASIAARTESFRLSTRDGQELGAWFVAGDLNRPVVLLLHGNGGCRGTCLRQVEFLTEAGCGVMLISFRAHGDSTGERNDFGYSAQHDVVAAVEW